MKFATEINLDLRKGHHFYYSRWSHNEESCSNRDIIIDCEIFGEDKNNSHLSLFTVFKVISIWVVDIEDLTQRHGLSLCKVDKLI